MSDIMPGGAVLEVGCDSFPLTVLREVDVSFKALSRSFRIITLEPLGIELRRRNPPLHSVFVQDI